MLTKPPVPYDFCIGVPISCLLTVGLTPVIAFNQENALRGLLCDYTTSPINRFAALGELPGPGGGLGGRRHPRLHPRAGVQQLVRAGNSDCNQQSVAPVPSTLNT